MRHGKSMWKGIMYRAMKRTMSLVTKSVMYRVTKSVATGPRRQAQSTLSVIQKAHVMRLTVMLVGLCTATVVVVTGCGNSRTILQQDETKYPEAVRLYQNGCITCHGSNLQGGIGPNLQHVGSQLTAAQIRHRIEVGSGPMPAYAAPGDAILTSAQITALTNWLAAKK
jgi:cytochrome c551